MINAINTLKKNYARKFIERILFYIINGLGSLLQIWLCACPRV